jgi:hypothetical protein
MTEHPLIKNLEALFRYSGMVDQLRDTSRVLHETGNVTATTLRSMASQYTALRAALAATLTEDVAAELPAWAPEIDPGTVSVDGIYFASAALARWIDLVHQTPKFMVAEEIAGAAAVEMSTKAKTALAAQHTPDPIKGTGTYL